MNRADRERFDAILEDVMASLPHRLRELLEETPVIVEDRPDPRLAAELGLVDAEETLCGLHSGTPLTDRSVMDAFDDPEMIHLFREGILAEAGGWERAEHEIRVTLLHEVGHHFGLTEEDLEALGYD